MPDLRITLIQTFVHWENIPENLRLFEGIIRPLKDATDLIVIPEMFSTGFSMKPAEFAEEMSGNAVEWMKRMANEVNAVITGSLIIKDDGKYYNRLIWMRPDGTHEIYDKRHLFRMGDEHNYYAAGSKRLIVSMKEWKICPLVCYDLRFPVWCRNGNQLAGGRRQEAGRLYDVLIFVANWPERRSFAWKHLLQARTIENQSYVIGVNRIGDDGNGVYHSGDSSLIDPLGEVIFTQADQPFIKTFVITKERLVYVRSKMPFLQDGDEFEVM